MPVSRTPALFSVSLWTAVLTLWSVIGVVRTSAGEPNPGGDGSAQVSGQVVDEKGQPVVGIEVMANAAGYAKDRFNETTHTDAAGKFQFRLPSNRDFMCVAVNKDLASPAVTRIIRAGVSVQDIKLVATPATRIFGQATLGPKNTPIRDKWVQLYLREPDDYYKLPESEKLPNPTNSNLAIMATIVRQTETDEDGRFEFFGGPGKYFIVSADNLNRPEFEITDQKSQEANLHAEREENGSFTGRVAASEHPNEPLAKATISGRGTEGFALFNAVTDAEGTFQGGRRLVPMILHAESEDKQLSGFARVGAEDTQGKIMVAQSVTAHGRLIDDESNGPAADREIDFGIQITFPDKTFTRAFGGSVTTNAEGEFTAKGLAPGEEYVFDAVVERNSDRTGRRWRKVASATAKPGNQAELGDVHLPKEYHPATAQEKVAKAFADERSLKQRIASRLRDTNHAYQRLLLVIGDPQSKAVQRLYELEYAEALHGAALNYQLVPVNVADADRAKDAGDYLTEIGIRAPQKDEALLAVLDEQGQLVDQVSILQPLSDGVIDPAKVTSFLNDHAPELPDAEVLYAEALANAKREGKRVFVQVSGPRCGWCFILSRFLDEHRDLIDKEFTYVKLDDRLKNGPDVIKRVHPTLQGGIPWFVFLDDTGKPLITSDGPDGNIGFPGEPESRVQFEKMLHAEPKHLSDDDIKSLMAALEKYKS